MAYVDSDGARIRYHVRGWGPPLMLIAGTGYSGTTWHPRLCEELAGSHTVITFDHRGTGGSSGSGEGWTTQTFAHDALAVLRAIDCGPAHVLGH